MNILQLLKLNDTVESYLRSIGNVTYVERNEVTKEDVKGQEVIIGNVPIALLEACDALKFLQLESAGSDGYAPIVREDVILTNASGSFGKTIAEHVVMVLLMLQRNMMQYMKMQERHEFGRIRHEDMIYKKRIAILGCGDLGMEVAKRLQAFDAYTIGLKRTYVGDIPYFDEVKTMDSFDEVIQDVDVIVSCLPRNEESNLLLDRKHLAMLKENAIFINVGRGNVVDEEALIECLMNDKIQGAALDVFMVEPLPEDSPLYTCKNLIITPHVSGTFACEKTKDIFCDIVHDNIERYINGEEMLNVVNRKTGYRELQGRIQK